MNQGDNWYNSLRERKHRTLFFELRNLRRLLAPSFSSVFDAVLELLELHPL